MTQSTETVSQRAPTDTADRHSTDEEQSRAIEIGRKLDAEDGGYPEMGVDLMDTIAADHVAAQAGEVKSRPYSEFRAEVMGTVAADRREAAVYEPNAVAEAVKALRMVSANATEDADDQGQSITATETAQRLQSWWSALAAIVEARDESVAGPCPCSTCVEARMAARPTGDA